MWNCRSQNISRRFVEGEEWLRNEARIAPALLQLKLWKISRKCSLRTSKDDRGGFILPKETRAKKEPNPPNPSIGGTRIGRVIIC